MSLGTSNRDGGKTSESGHLRALAKVVSGDVLEGLVASQRAAGLNMSVDISTGDAFIRRSDGSYAHPVFNDAVYNQAISTADGSNPRRDIVVMYVDYLQAPSTAVSNNTNGVVKIKVVNGTPAGSPTDPSDAAIQSSVGSGNPWTKICRVRVPAGQTSITNSLIDDLRTLASGLQQTGGVVQVRNSEASFDFVASGCVWTGDSYGSTRNGSMTAGVVYINGKRVAVSAISAHTFTASKDTYVDVGEDGVVDYSESTNNAASQTLAADHVRLAVIITGASNILNVGSVNQGQEFKLLPIASSIPYAVTDSIGNLICPRDPNRKVLGERRLYNSNISRASATIGDFSTVLSCPVIIPAGRKVKVSLGAEYVFTSGASGQGMTLVIYDVTSSANVHYIQLTAAGANYTTNPHFGATYTPPASGARTFKPMGSTSSGTLNLTGNTVATNFIYIKVELE